MKAIKVAGTNIDKEVIIATQTEDTKQSISKSRDNFYQHLQCDSLFHNSSPSSFGATF